MSNGIKQFDAVAGDLMLCCGTKRRPPYSLAIVVAVDAQGWASRFVSIDGKHQRDRGQFETCFRFKSRPGVILQDIQRAADEATDVADLEARLKPFRDEAFYAAHPDAV